MFGHVGVWTGRWRGGSFGEVGAWRGGSLITEGFFSVLHKNVMGTHH